MGSNDTELEAEARAAYLRFVEARDAVERGERAWSDLAEEFFTEDVVFVDPAWGRTEGREQVARFMDESMQGLDDWEFPEAWTMVEGDRIVSFWWNRLPGRREDGTPYQAPGVSIVHYAGDGRFSYELDLLNMAEVGELFSESRWSPTGPMNLPPKVPNRDSTPPQREQP